MAKTLNTTVVKHAVVWCRVRGKRSPQIQMNNNLQPAEAHICIFGLLHLPFFTI